MKKDDISEKDGEKEHSERVFDGLQLKGKAITSVKFYACVFKNCDLTGVSLRFCTFKECRFESCNLSLLKAGASSFPGTVFKDSKLMGINWTEADWPKLSLAGPPQFHNCVLSDCNFLGLALAGVEIKNCLAKEADFREADLSGADFSGTELAGSLFGGTNLAKANLAGARNYAINVKANQVKDARFSLPEAMSLLYCLDIKIV